MATLEVGSVVRASAIPPDTAVFQYDVFLDEYRETTAAKLSGMLVYWTGEQWRVHSNER